MVGGLALFFGLIGLWNAIGNEKDRQKRLAEANLQPRIKIEKIGTIGGKIYYKVNLLKVFNSGLYCYKEIGEFENETEATNFAEKVIKNNYSTTIQETIKTIM